MPVFRIVPFTDRNRFGKAKALTAQSQTADGEMSQTSTPTGHLDIDADALHKLVLESLDDSKAEDIESINITGKSSIADYMVVASGRSHRHVNAVADRLLRDMKAAGLGSPKVEGMPACDWVLVDIGDVIVHIFRPEVRDFYSLEKMWNAVAEGLPTE